MGISRLFNTYGPFMDPAVSSGSGQLLRSLTSPRMAASSPT